MESIGATTGRPRRMGWFDCVASKYGCRMQGSYRCCIYSTWMYWVIWMRFRYVQVMRSTAKLQQNSRQQHLLEKAKPVLEVLPGWKSDIRGIKNYDELPENCRKYIEFVEKADRIPDHNDLQWTRKK